MTFPTDRVRDVTVLEVTRELTLENRDELKRTVRKRLDAGDRKFVLDFERTGFIDSSGLGVLVSLSKKIREEEGELRLVGLSEELRTTFELTRLDTLFQICDSRSAALGEI